MIYSAELVTEKMKVKISLSAKLKAMCSSTVSEAKKFYLSLVPVGEGSLDCLV